MTKNILVTSYIDPDLDGTAGAMAYTEYLQKTGRKAVCAIMGEVQVEAKYVFERFNIGKPKIIKDTKEYDEIILVDASDLKFFEGKLLPGKVIEIIDHRKVNEAEKFPKAEIQIELVGSACTLVAEKFIKKKVDVSADSAILLCSAIISNTLNFHASNTTDRDKDAYKWLNQKAELSDGYWRELFLAKSDLSGPKLKERIISDFANFTIADRELGIAQIELIGAKKLVDERGNEIVSILEKMKKEMKLDDIFANVLDLENHEKFNITSNQHSKELLEKVLGIHFAGDLARDEKKIMRKQIVSMIKDYLESK